MRSDQTELINRTIENIRLKVLEWFQDGGEDDDDRPPNNWTDDEIEDTVDFVIQQAFDDMENHELQQAAERIITAMVLERISRDTIQ